MRLTGVEQKKERQGKLLNTSIITNQDATLRSYCLGVALCENGYREPCTRHLSEYLSRMKT